MVMERNVRVICEASGDKLKGKTQSVFLDPNLISSLNISETLADSNGMTSNLCDEGLPNFLDPTVIDSLRISHTLVDRNRCIENLYGESISKFSDTVLIENSRGEQSLHIGNSCHQGIPSFPDPILVGSLNVSQTCLDRNELAENLNGQAVSDFLGPVLIDNLRISQTSVNQNGLTGVLNDDGPPSVMDLHLINSLGVCEDLLDQNPFAFPQLQSDPRLNVVAPSNEGDAHEDFDFNDGDLNYIGQMLMEENMEEKVCMFQESTALQDTERSFYEAIGEKYPPPASRYTVSNSDQNGILVDGNYHNSIKNANSRLLCPKMDPYPSESDIYTAQCIQVSVPLQTISQSSYSTSSSSGTVNDGHVDSPVSTLRIPEICNSSESIMKFTEGVEETSLFLPNGKKRSAEKNEVAVNMEKNYENLHNEDLEALEGRSNKQSAVSSDSTLKPEVFDMVLLCSGGRNESALRQALQIVSIKNATDNDDSKASNGKKSRRKKQRGKRDTVDLRTLLTLCAEAVVADDRRNASEFLKQLRQHSSQTGDGMQRLAHYFADGLEARMAGSGTQIYKALITKPTSAADILKAYQLFLAICPFRKISNFFSNKTTMNLAQSATSVHVIDFGILYGFQWPCFIQRLSSRKGGPPRLRITGIDLPQPGFRPAERVEETGKRLANYAERFNVPFEFNAIAKKWETIKVEDIKINKDEVLVVNCLFRLRNLLDETVVVNSPRDIVLKLIRELNPHVFIQGIVNGAYNSPFFITRFREALFHFSSLFDMLDTNVPRNIHERMLIEKTIIGQEAKNVIACETAERVERPETYKQWHVRNMRAGFLPLPLNKEIMKMSRDRAKIVLSTRSVQASSTKLISSISYFCKLRWLSGCIDWSFGSASTTKTTKHLEPNIRTAEREPKQSERPQSCVFDRCLKMDQENDRNECSGLQFLLLMQEGHFGEETRCQFSVIMRPFQPANLKCYLKKVRFMTNKPAYKVIRDTKIMLKDVPVSTSRRQDARTPCQNSSSRLMPTESPNLLALSPIPNLKGRPALLI
nr:scarecrow-like protein 14 [Ipomoea batatas]